VARLRGLLGPIAVTLIAAVVAGGLLWWWSVAPGGDEGFVLSAAPSGEPTGPAMADGSAMADGPAVADTTDSAVAVVGTTGAAPSPSVTVHVAGAVARPGVVVVVSGARVIDAVAAAGGLSGEADAGGVNLARPVVDGELVMVPTPGQIAAAPGAAGGGSAVVGGAVPGAGTPGSPGPGSLVDINRADEAGLDALPGIGPVLAGRIIAYREDVGPFGGVEELRSVPGIGEKVFDGIRDLVTV